MTNLSNWLAQSDSRETSPEIMAAYTTNARFAGTCHCSRTFAQGARITIDAFKRVIACYECIADRKAETMRRIQVAIDPKGD